MPPEIDETDLIIAQSVIDEFGRRSEKRRHDFWKNMRLCIWSTTAVTVAGAITSRWAIWGVGFTLQMLCLPVMLLGYKRIEKDCDAWLESRLPSWCKGITKLAKQKPKGEEND